MMKTVSDEAQSPSALLPFYVNGTLENEEKSRVETALQNDPELREELMVLRELREVMQAETVEHIPGELMLARLKRDIALEKTVKLKRFDFRPLGSFVAGLAVAGLIAVVMIPKWNADTSPYSLASGGVGENYKLLVEIKAGVQAHELTSLLQDLQLTIIAGPSARGLYHLQGHDNAATEQVLGKLQSRRDIFIYLQLDMPE